MKRNERCQVLISQFNTQDGSVLLTTFLFVISRMNNVYITPYRIILDVTTLVSNMYGSLGRVLFAILCHLITDMYKLIGKKIDKLMTVDAEIPNSLKQLKSEHLLVFRCVGELNRCFGPILLFDIIFTFIGFINWSMYSLTILVSVEMNWLFVMLIISSFTLHTANLILICFSSDRIHVEVFIKLL